MVIVVFEKGLLIVRIEVLDKSRYREYEEFLLCNENSLFYHSTKYKDFLEDLLDCESRYLLAYENRKIVAALPLMIKEGPLGKVINSLPYYGSNGGILTSCAETHEALTKAYSDLICSSHVVASTYIPNVFTADQYPHKFPYDYTDERIGQVTFLCDHKESKNIFDRIDSSSRRNIRRAIKEGVQVSINNDALEFLTKTHQENMAVIGGREKSPDFFQSIAEHFEQDKDYKIYTATLNGKLIAALLLFYFNKTVEYFTPVTVAEFRSTQPMALILYTAMMDAIKSGYKYWNWGATWPTQEGVYKFKGKWGAQDYLYKYYVKINNPRILKASATEILENYPNFFVVPFKYLEKKE